MSGQPLRTARTAETGDRYKWVALSNTTVGAFMATLDGSIVIIALPAIFRGIELDPLAPGNIGYLLWMVLGYLLVTGVLVATLGRLGDLYGRVRLFNLGFAVFTGASLALSLDPFVGPAGAWWLIVWRLVQAVGGSMLLANSSAILTDAFPLSQRGMALGINQISALSGQFLGLLAGGLLAELDWRAVFWVNVPIGVAGTIWSYRRLREIGVRRRTRIDWRGSVLFCVALTAVLVAITYGIQPHDGRPTGWSNPWVMAGIASGLALLVVFCIVESRVADPIVVLSLFRIRAFAAGNVAALLMATARGGLQFMLVLWLQGIWLPLHGYDFHQTPLWAGIYLLPLTAGFLIAGPFGGHLSDRHGSRGLASTGMIITAGSFVGLLMLPVNFSYPTFAVLLFISGIGQGLFSAPNTAAVMNSVPERFRGGASGMRSTFQNCGQSLSVGVFFSLLASGLASSLPTTLSQGLREHGVDEATAADIAHFPPVSTLFATFLGENPVAHLLGPRGTLQHLPTADVDTLTGREFFPQLISPAFDRGLAVVFTAATAMVLLGAVSSLLRGRRSAPAARSAKDADARVSD